MKLFTGVRQTGNTLRMMKHSEEMLKLAMLRDDELKGDWKMLIVTPSMRDSIRQRREFIEYLRGKGINIPEHYDNVLNDVIIQVKSDMRIAISAKTSKDVTLDDLNKYDAAIIDYVFIAHPYKERILIRTTVE